MSNFTSFSPTTKKAYKRPYKSRGQRREVDRRKYDESSDHRFLIRVAVALGLLLALVVGFVAKGLTDQEGTTTQVFQTRP